MPSVDWTQAEADVWDIAVPNHLGRLPGIAMAGFRERLHGELDLHMVPYPAVTLGIDLGDVPLVVRDADGPPRRGSVAVGLAPRELQVQGPAVECLQVRLSPMVARAVLGASNELSGSVIGLDELWGPDAARLEDRLRTAPSWDERFAIAEDALRSRLQTGRAPDPEVRHAWSQMRDHHGQVRIEEIATETGWSRKRLWTRFRSQVGLTPKRAAQLVRFDHAAHLLAAGRSAATVAAESGYADQSHCIRDFREPLGETPAAFLARGQAK